MTTTMIYPVALYTDNSKAQDGYRMSVVAFKTPSDKKGDATYKKPPTLFTSIPRIAVMVEPSILSKALQTAFEELQDTVVRKTIEQFLSDKVSIDKMGIADSLITPQGVADFAATEAISKRLSKEAIEAWFDKVLSDNLTVRLIERATEAGKEIGDETSPVMTAIATNIASAKKLFASLASPRSSFPDHIVKQLQQAMKLVDASEIETPIYQQLGSKLRAFLEPKEVTLELNL